MLKWLRAKLLRMQLFCRSGGGFGFIRAVCGTRVTFLCFKKDFFGR